MEIRKRSPGNSRVMGRLFPLAAGTLVVIAMVAAILALRPVDSGNAVLVAADDIQANQSIEPGQVRAAFVPSSATPDGALSKPEQLSGLVAPHPLPRGTVLTRANLVSKADILPPGSATIQLELGPGALGVEAGDSVQVWGPPEACTLAEGAVELLERHARVQAVNAAESSMLSGNSGSLVTLTVSETAVPDVLCAAHSGAVHLVRTSG